MENKSFAQYIPLVARSEMGASDNGGHLFFKDTENGNKLTSVDEFGVFTVYCECGGYELLLSIAQNLTFAPQTIAQATNYPNAVSISYSYDAVGEYTLNTDSNIFDDTNFYMIFEAGNAPLGSISAERLTASSVKIRTRDWTGALADSIMYQSGLRITWIPKS